MKIISPRIVPQIADAESGIEFLHNLEFSAIPRDVAATAKLLILDTIAVSLAARAATGMPAIREIVSRETMGPATLWGEQDRVSVSSAAFYNGSLASALDFDSLHSSGGVHADAVVLPAAFASAEAQNSDGKALIAAYVAGIEATVRLSGAGVSSSGWFRTSIYGVFGAAVAAAKLFNLNPQQFSSAIGLASGQASGTQQAHIERTLLKRMQAGFAARAGIFSAQLASQGLTGPTQPFDGKFGLYALYDDGDPSQLFASLGKDWLLPRTAIKKYPGCACSHAAIEAALQLRSQHSLQESDIRRVRITITPYMNRLVGAPFSKDGDPEVTGQFCAQYAVAAAFVRGKFSLEDLEASAVLDPALDSFLSRIELAVGQDSTERLTPATVQVVTNDNRILQETVATLPGQLDLPAEGEQIIQKAHSSLTAGRYPMSESNAKVLIEKIMSLEALPNVHTLLGGIPSV